MQEVSIYSTLLPTLFSLYSFSLTSGNFNQWPEFSLWPLPIRDPSCIFNTDLFQNAPVMRLITNHANFHIFGYKQTYFKADACIVLNIWGNDLLWFGSKITLKYPLLLLSRNLSPLPKDPPTLAVCSLYLKTQVWPLERFSKVLVPFSSRWNKFSLYSSFTKCEVQQY